MKMINNLLFFILILSINNILAKFNENEECFTATFYDNSELTNCQGELSNVVDGVCEETCVILPSSGEFDLSMIVFCNNSVELFPNPFCGTNDDTFIFNIQFPFCWDNSFINSTFPVDFLIELKDCTETTKTSNEKPPTTNVNDITSLLIVIIVLTSIMLCILILFGFYYARRSNEYLTVLDLKKKFIN